MAQTLNTTVRARIDSNVKLSAEAILSSIGMDPSDAIRLFPLELRTPNQKTIDAMNADVEAEAFDSSDALFDSILGSNDDTKHQG